MSALMYWRERLLNKQPFYSDKMRIEGVTYKLSRKDPSDVWPHSIRRNSMYQDYCIWHEEVYLKPYQDSGYYSSAPEHMPQCLKEMEFFSTIAPWLYVVGRKEQVRTYPVKIRKMLNGELWEAVQKHYFVRLCYWEQHIAAFELFTGMSLNLPVSYFQPQKAEQVVQAIKEYKAELDHNRAVFGEYASGVHKVQS